MTFDALYGRGFTGEGVFHSLVSSFPSSFPPSFSFLLLFGCSFRMRYFSTWITLSSCRLSPTCYASSSFPRASSVACFLLALFVAVGSDAGTRTLYCAGLKCVMRGTSEANTPICDYCWYVSGSPQAADDYAKFPYLEGMNSYVGANGHMRWYPKPWTDSNYEYYYTFATTTTQQIPDDWSQDDVNSLVNDSYFKLPLLQRNAVNGVICSSVSSSDGSTSKSSLFTHRAIGTPVGWGSSFSGVVTYDTQGNVIVSSPNSDGYVVGNELNPMGGTTPVFYRYDSSNNQVVKLSGYESTTSDALSYDSQTGLYSFQQPNYDNVLGGIYSSVSDLSQFVRNNPFVVDLKNPLVVPAPEVTVNPEITVEAPQVTVNPEVTVTPTVTVTPNVTVEAPQVTVNGNWSASDISTVKSDLSSVKSSTQGALSRLNSMIGEFATELTDDFDLSASSLTEEEQSLLDVPQQWNTQIPLIGNAANVAFGAFLGNIPDPGRELRPLNLQVLGFNMVIDFSPYSTYISWFRAFVLMLEFIWFLDCIWRSVVKVLAV